MTMLTSTTNLDELVASLDLTISADDVAQAKEASAELQRQNEASAMIYRMFAAPTEPVI